MSASCAFLQLLNPSRVVAVIDKWAQKRGQNRPKKLVLGCIWVTQGPCGLGACPGAYLVVGACCVGCKWHFSVKMARWGTPRVPFRGAIISILTHMGTSLRQLLN